MRTAAPPGPSHTAAGRAADDDDDDEEEDYMSMILPLTPTATKHETSAQRRRRREREAEAARRPGPKRIPPNATATAALSRPLHETLPPSSAAHRMMARLGFDPATRKTLGRDPQNPDARAEPIAVEMKIDRGGIGMDSERKRKVMEQVEGEAKRVKAGVEGYRGRVAGEREEKRVEGLWWAGMGVVEGLWEDGESSSGSNENVSDDRELQEGVRGEETQENRRSDTLPLKAIPVYWRGLIRSRREKDLERRQRHDLLQSLAREPTYEEDSDDPDTIHGKVNSMGGFVEAELEEEDEELETHLALPIKERLELLLEYMRETWRYCFWCKHRYEDVEMEGCPGGGEDGHGVLINRMGG